MLRALALTALIANLGFFAWTQGYLRSLGLPPLGAGEREPQRLERQVRPESIVILNPSVTVGRPGSAPMPGLAPAGSPAPDSPLGGNQVSPAASTDAAPAPSQDANRQREGSEPGR